jgi:hypothetical protein
MSAKPKKKDLVKFDVSGFPTLHIDPDKKWEHLKTLSVENRRESILTDFHFLIQLHAMKISEKIKTRFIKDFTKSAAIKHRSVAMRGLIQANYDRVFDLLINAVDLDKGRECGAFTDDKESGFSAMAVVSIGFSEIIAKRDTASLRRMITIIENKGIPDGTRGGVGSEEGYMLEKFCDLHFATRSLPTKKALREACKIQGNNPDKLAEKMMKKLGLWGLPTEPEI